MPKKKRRKSKRKLRMSRPKVCRFCEDAILYIDFKDVETLNRYTTEQGKILPRRITGTCFDHQRMLSRAMKIARNLATL